MIAMALALTLQANSALPAQTQLCAVVDGVTWANPRTQFDLEVLASTNGAPIGRWKVSGQSPNYLLRSGITRDSVRPGTLIIVDVSWSGDPCSKACEGQGEHWNFADGRKMFFPEIVTAPPQDDNPPRPTAVDCPKGGKFKPGDSVGR
jgi:hypothetical protein